MELWSWWCNSTNFRHLIFHNECVEFYFRILSPRWTIRSGKSLRILWEFPNTQSNIISSAKNVNKPRIDVLTSKVRRNSSSVSNGRRASVGRRDSRRGPVEKGERLEARPPKSPNKEANSRRSKVVDESVKNREWLIDAWLCFGFESLLCSSFKLCSFNPGYPFRINYFFFNKARNWIQKFILGSWSYGAILMDLSTLLECCVLYKWANFQVVSIWI